MKVREVSVIAKFGGRLVVCFYLGNNFHNQSLHIPYHAKVQSVTDFT